MVELPSVLIIDDTPTNLGTVVEALELQGYRVLVAQDGEEGIERARFVQPDLILLDVLMPGIDGFETCRRLKADAELREIPVIFMTALSQISDKVAGFEAGGVDYVTKPFQLDEVLARVAAQVQLRRMQRKLNALVEERTAELRATCESLEKSRADYRRMLEQTAMAIALTVEKRDSFTAGHEARVTHLAVAIGQRLGLSQDTLDGLRVGGMIHDIGKISLPAEILSRPGPLSPTEFELVKGHADTGHEILSHVEFPWPVADMVRQHHERLDGSGYPQGLKDGELLIEGRILAVADVVEAMASHRPYRPALGIEQALNEIRSGAGRLYDRDVTDVCLQLFESGYQLPK